MWLSHVDLSRLGAAYAPTKDSNVRRFPSAGPIDQFKPRFKFILGVRRNRYV